ncbi:MAG: class I poly(R)-hydroxyalkanoic acid synthase [Rubellimicrobium sp.]|nr:class I poly(R)-hydroxyalkanoic acid synthase [Rubellimicrobium sp.]
MTTTDRDLPEQESREATELEKNLRRIEELSQRLVQVMGRRRQVPAGLQGPSPELYAHAAQAMMQQWATDPASLIERQVGYWADTVKHFAAAQQAFLSGMKAPEDPGPKDRRFANPLWDTNPWFNFLKQQYLRNSAAISESVKAIEGLDDRERRRLEYFANQIVNMMSPANFLGTNPDALERAVATEGRSLVDGLENLVRDLEANDGELIVSLADRDAFSIGQNIATTPGAVVWRNRMLELIQYEPTTPRVHETPLVIFPPWINKFYILDLKAQNSLIKWIVDQGFTLFVASWKNPGPDYADVSLSTYVDEGIIATIREVRAICGTKKVNAVGYCIAGTTLSLALGVMRKRRDHSVNSASFFTTLTDFSDQGEIGVFLDNDFVDAIEAEVDRKGILDRLFMARTFSFLRSNDLVYQPAIRSYMLGESPPAFDLLFWNGDGTNLPAKMAVEYLRGLYQQNLLATSGIAVAGEMVTLADVTVPLCAIACETDHIAGWRSSYRGVQKMGAKDKTFILSESGHVAGIVNPPTRNKYGHYTNADLSLDPAAWRAGAERHEGSWWPRWGAWLGPRSGPMVAARAPGDSTHPALAPAPGTYVTEEPPA